MKAFKCPKCGKTTMGWENYCVKCGESLNTQCPVCSEEWRYMFIYDYCPNCGHDMKVEVPAKEKPVKLNYTQKEIKK